MPFKDLEKEKEYQKAYGKRYRAENKEKIFIRVRKWQKENKEKINNQIRMLKIADPEKFKARNKENYIKHREKKAKYAKEYLQKNFEKCSATAKAWRDNNPALRSSYEAKRRFSKLKATPKWANYDEIEKFYIEAAKMQNESGISHHVDHIVPLQSKLVCGLHCEANLQVLIGSENIRKGNRVWPDMP